MPLPIVSRTITIESFTKGAGMAEETVLKQLFRARTARTAIPRPGQQTSARATA
jgi:hypothetical protein